QQFDHTDIVQDEFQMNVLDAIAGNAELNTEYTTRFQQYRSISRQLAEKTDQLAQWQKESDYKQFLLDELLQLNFKENEIEEADQQLKQISHAERIISILQSSRYLLEEGEQPIINELKKINQQLQGITEVMTDVTPLQVRISSVYEELKDVCSELEGLEGSVSLDEELMQQLQERLDAGYKMMKKHAVTTTNELLALQRKLQEELKSTLDLSDTIERLNNEKQATHNELLSIADKLSLNRKKVAPEITAKINELLAAVGMPNARFDILLKNNIEPGPMGMDTVSFLLDANKSGQFLPVHKAASGGEMSRIMLCIKSLTAQAMHLPTLIFDEVDTGISGEAARQVAVLLRDLSKYHQVICITHQPQVAAKGTKHFYVYKDVDTTGRITTRLRILQQDERVLAIAQMIGGEKPSEAAMQNARELVTL
ncbi:MAG: DNA repair protein RecN, partial [Flavipsychrobacter sp.]